VTKADLIEKVKANRLLYLIYYYIGSIFINILKHFVETDNKLILFVSYGGRHFNDSPKILYDAMLSDERFSNYRLIWAFRCPENFNIPETNKVRIDTLRYYIIALQARCWITNTVVQRALNFKGKNTYYFCTTHGVFPKYSGRDVKNRSFDTKARYQYDCSCAQSELEAQLQTKILELNRENVIVCGYPRNDKLVHYSKEEVEKVKKVLKIPERKIVILYAPTFRENAAMITNVQVNFDFWERELGSNYIILFRAHPVTKNGTQIKYDSKFVMDCSDYPDIMDLYLISDILISDYSGVFFDFAILERPMICYGYDYEQYVQTRNMYMNLCEELPGGKITESELIQIIKNTPNMEDIEKIKNFKNKYITAFGNATASCLDNIYLRLREEK